ncbi:MAG: cob(I)yrinic acid a,c-diamide adenosyltransferase [Chloroflexi bacterium]|nr:cob(I)yrinic acid a,c-diamide adenosyltransferase [Chloroflexota bacterium]MDA1270171.1 cob(I)yrinic acid a,c-diamide adenosyltransferase [Chloroflexota bacterium]
MSTDKPAEQSPNTAAEAAEGPQSVTGPRINKGLLIVNTGKGKGKTTAAMGVAMRAWGRDMKVIILQFIKHSTANFGEQRAAHKMGIEIRAMGDGFTWRSKDLDQSADLARAQWEDCKEVIASGDYDLVVLDEFTYPMHYGWVDTEEVIQTLKARPEMQHVIITGRNAPEALMEYADLVSEMQVIKHPYQQGIKAQPGIEF